MSISHVVCMFLASRVAYWLQLVHLWELGQILVDPSVCHVSLMAYLVTNPPEVRKCIMEYHIMAVKGKGRAAPVQYRPRLALRAPGG